MRIPRVRKRSMGGTGTDMARVCYYRNLWMKRNVQNVFEYKLSLFPVQSGKCMQESTNHPKKDVLEDVDTNNGARTFFTQAGKDYHPPGWKFCFGEPSKLTGIRWRRNISASSPVQTPNSRCAHACLLSRTARQPQPALVLSF